MMNFDQFLSEAILPMKHYSEESIVAHISKYLDKKVDELPRRAVNFYNNAIYMLKKKYSGYDPDEDTHEGSADEEFMKILKKTYAIASR